MIPILIGAGIIASSILGAGYFFSGGNEQTTAQETQSKLDSKQETKAKQPTNNYTYTYETINDNKNFTNSFNGASNVGFTNSNIPKIESKAQPQVSPQTTPQILQIPTTQQQATSTTQKSILENPLFLVGGGLLAYNFLKEDKK